MRIAFDAQLLLKGEKTGIGWCAENILQEFKKYENQEKILNCFTLGYDDSNKENVYKYSAKGYEINACKLFNDTVYRMLWSLIPVPYWTFFGNKADITIFFNYAVPPGVKGKKIVFIHDMSYLAVSETVRIRTKKFLKLVLKKSCSRADKIITVSEFSKQEIIKYLNVSEDKIEVIPLGVDLNRFHSHYCVEDKMCIAKKYSLPEQYFLYLGTIEPRKNLSRLIQAYATLLKQAPELPDLILAGKKGWLCEPIYQAAEEFNVRNKVHFLGYTAAEDVPVLLSGAELFIFPSLYEGFGLPPLEAMACGVPVITADAASLPEVVGNAAVLVNPYDTESIAEGIFKTWKDRELQRSLIQKGICRASEFTWGKTAEKLRRICAELE